MASAIKRSGTWYAKWKDAFGRQQRKATTAKTRKECEALAHELEVESERGRFGLQALPAKSTITLGELCDLVAQGALPEEERAERALPRGKAPHQTRDRCE